MWKIFKMKVIYKKMMQKIIEKINRIKKYVLKHKIIFVYIIAFFALIAFITLIRVLENTSISKSIEYEYIQANQQDAYKQYANTCKNNSKKRVLATSISEDYDNEYCKSRMIYPVKEANIIKDFDAPSKPWLAGHRGVDLQAKEGDELRAPQDGIIAFVGLVAGKSVVTISHGVLTSTFEPAYTDLPVGSIVKKGQNFAYVTVGSDHCDNLCVQWGLKRRNRTYANPKQMVQKQKIVLKPKEDLKEK